jgi:putative ABC transport system permease protein
VKGVARAAPAMWFGGYLRDPRDEVVVVAVDPVAWLDAYPELIATAEQREAFIRDKTGLLVGARLAQRLGWRIGDRIPLRSNFWTRADGADSWPVTVRGIFTGADARANTDRAYLHYSYLDEGRGFLQGMVQQVTIQTVSSSVNDEVVSAIDAMTRNSAHETKTAGESAFRQAMLRQVGDLSAILAAIMAAAFTSILLIVGATTAMSARRRAKEFAIMRTLGFTGRRVAVQIFSETVLLCLIGGAAGLAASAAAISALQTPLRSVAPTLAFSPWAIISALAAIALLSIATGLAPALMASRARIVDALGRA